MKKSIRQQLLLWLLIPLLTLALASTVLANILGVQLARSIYDKQLLNSADSVAARLTLKNNVPTVDLPPAAQAILRHNYHDDFSFQVYTPEGKLIDGDQTLPPPTDFTALSEPSFRTMKLSGGKEMRIAALILPTPIRQYPHMCIQVGETRNTRLELAGQITMSILLAQLLLIVCGCVAVWIGVGRGLMPLLRIEQVVNSRAPGDLSPLDVEEPTEVLSLIRALNKLFKQLQDDVDAKKRFISNAAHQMRTPLAALGTYSALANKMASDQELRDVLSDLDTGIVRMTKLVNQLLSLARFEPSAAGTVSSAVFDLNHSASVVCAAHVPAALKKRIEIEFLSAERPAMIKGEQFAVEELISNLIDNAVTYCRFGGNVTVKVLVRESGSTLVIEDEGPGIAEEQRERVFERFYRVPGTDQPGTGLGLAIVREIATNHAATIEVKSGPNNIGTAIIVTFPKTLEAGKAAPAPEPNVLV